MAERRLHVLNNSRAMAFRRCPRLHYYSYELGYVAREKAAALETGTRYHAWLEAWWKAVMNKRDPSAVLEAAMTALEPADDPYEQARAETLVYAYHHRWIGEPMEVLGVEASFEGPLLDPLTGDRHPVWVLAGTVDALVRVGGRVLVVEHKTSSQDITPGSYYWQKLTLNSQVSQYIAAGSVFGAPIVGCLYDVIGKAPDVSPKLATPEADRKYTKEGVLYARQRSEDEPVEEFRARLIAAISEEPERYLGRAEIVRLGDELEEAALDVWQVGELIDEARAKARWPRNTDQCFAFNRACEFLPVCAHGVDLKSSELYVCEREGK